MDYSVYAETPDFYINTIKKSGKFNMVCQHYHAAYEIFLMLDGERYVFFNDSAHRLSKGDLFIIDPYVLHHTENRDSEYFERCVLNITQDFMSPMFTSKEMEPVLKNIHTGVIHLKDEEFKAVHRQLILTEHYAARPIPFCTKILYSQLYILLYELNKLCEHSSHNRPDTLGMAYSKDFAKAIYYINKNYGQNISLDFIADYAHMCKSHFCYVFAKETGTTFLQYLNSLRAAEAHRLLLETDLPVHQISDKLGFSSTAHMTRIFKSIHGLSPSAFRKQKNKESL